VGAIISGTNVRIKGTFTDADGVAKDPSGKLSLLIVDPAGVEVTLEGGSLTKDAVGIWHGFILANVAGLWNYRWLDEGESADEGTFEVESSFEEGLTPDLTDLRVIVPRARRACEGPYGAPAGRPALQNEQIYQMVADSCSEIILFSGSLFGQELEVKSRDPLVGFPTAWKTGRMLTEWETALIVTQVALDYFFHLFRDMKTSETQKNEGTEWTWTLSANVLRNYLENLKSQRDMALEGLRRHHPVLDVYASNIRVRDQATVGILEWWDTVSPGLSGGVGIPGGQEAAVIPWTPGWSGPGWSP
jgi:hypothetical protein